MSAPERLVPVTLLTGFLGSGKTTVLNRLLKRPDLRGAVVIVNEFGEIGLDHLLIEASEESFALLDNGCVCCTVRQDLVATLKDISRRVAGGAMPPTERVLIETTGLADPAPILHTLMAEAELMASYRIDRVITTIDAVNGPSTLVAHAEAAKQAAIADCLLVTKVDLVGAAALATLERQIRRLSPTAEVLHASDAVGPLTGVFDAYPSEAARAVELAASLQRAESAGREVVCEPHSHHHHHDHAAAHAHNGIQSFSFAIDEPVHWPAFAQWLDYIATLKGEDLLRVKGIVNVAGEPDRPLILHGVQHVFHPPARLNGWPSADHRSRLVFIVRDIAREMIERTLMKFAAVRSSTDTTHRTAA